MKLTTLHHEGRRCSYYTLVKVEIFDDPTVAKIVDETGLWTATVQLDERLDNRMGEDAEAYFYARIRGGEIDLHDRELDPDLSDWGEP